MGEVYSAHDTKLGRQVAIKILPDTFTHDPERLARFRREAQVLAALNHPHIAAIYGLDEANGRQFLVLELVDGETLADRLTRGRLSVDDALTIAMQIADALEAAHEKGITHCDLKPANIALTPEGSRLRPQRRHPRTIPPPIVTLARPKSSTLTAFSEWRRCDRRDGRVHEPGTGARTRR